MTTPSAVPEAALGTGKKVALGLVCVLAGAAPLSYGFIDNDLLRFLYTVGVAVAYLAFTLRARSDPSLRRYWELAFAFFVLAVVGVLNNLARNFGSYVLHSPPVAGNPLASSVTASVLVQLVETAVAIVTIFVLTRSFGLSLGTVYARPGRLWALFLATLAVFVLLLVFTARHQSSLFPTNGMGSQGSFLTLAPALLVLVVSNGFQEEFLFRGPFLQRYGTHFGGPASVLISSIVFAIAHLGVTYTPSAIFFILVAVFPLGLVTAFLMRRTDGIVTPAVLHAGFDVPVYWSFLTYVS
ncbi:MAG TPA: CPBP family intramembrane glutamic endopeptidase [Thermoplasmata archaeon]|nr:CPBP family intramembrane glutamic endopeptidase [Thermoplasmata archaeon]